MDGRGLVKPGGLQTQLPANFAVPQGLVGYWGFDPDCLDFTNNLATDMVGANTGSLLGATKPALANGIISGSLLFDGSTSYAASGGNADIIGAAPRSVSIWANPTSVASGSKYLFCWGVDSARNAFAVTFGTGGAGIAYVYTNTTDWFTATGAVAANVWTHVAVTYNGGAAQTADNIKLYLNGLKASLSFIGGGVGALNTTNSPINFGTNILHSASFFPGQLDDARIYNRALDPWEITVLYQAGLSGRRDAGQNMPQWTEVGAA
jgi:hypothetical protein